MVETRISRQAVEVASAANGQASVTRIDVEAAASAAEASSGAARVSRMAVEVLSAKPPAASVTRLDVEVAAFATAPGTDSSLISRQSVEILSTARREAAVTRLDIEVAGLATVPSSGSALISRQSLEMLTRRGAAGTVSPLPLATGIEVFLHNWASEVRLNTSYVNDIAYSPSTGAETRLGLSEKPERSMRLMWQTDDRARLDRLYVMLRKFTDERVAVPLYCDQRELPNAVPSSATTVFFDTSKGRWFAGARVVIVQLDGRRDYVTHSFHIIESMENDRINLTAALGVDVPANSIIMPMMDCEIVLEASLEKATARNSILTLEVVEVAGPSALPPTKADIPSGAQTFAGKPIFEIEPNWVRGINKGRSRQGRIRRQGVSNVVEKHATRSREVVSMDLLGKREDIWRAVQFFDTRRGSLRTFWAIDHEQIWEVAQIDAGGVFVGITAFGNFDDFKAELEGGWLGLVMRDGTVYVRDVPTVQNILGVYRVTLGTLLPASLSTSDVVRVARGRSVRYARDEQEERWFHTGVMGLKVEFIETLEEKQVDI